MPKDVAQPIAKLISELGDPLVGGATVRTRVAAVFHQRDAGVRRSQRMVVRVIHRPIEPRRYACVGHPVSVSSEFSAKLFIGNRLARSGKAIIHGKAPREKGCNPKATSP